MFFLFLYCFILLSILSTLWVIWSSWKFRSDFNIKREKASAFECGFDGNKTFRSAFSFRFFYILIMFLIFDMELALLFAFPMEESKNISLVFYMELILMILVVGLVYEWFKGALNWKE